MDSGTTTRPLLGSSTAGYTQPAASATGFLVRDAGGTSYYAVFPSCLVPLRVLCFSHACFCLLPPPDPTSGNPVAVSPKWHLQDSSCSLPLQSIAHILNPSIFFNEQAGPNGALLRNAPPSGRCLNFLLAGFPFVRETPHTFLLSIERSERIRFRRSRSRNVSGARAKIRPPHAKPSFSAGPREITMVNINSVTPTDSVPPCGFFSRKNNDEDDKNEFSLAIVVTV